jgi:hypothetical protein
VARDTLRYSTIYEKNLHQSHGEWRTRNNFRKLILPHYNKYITNYCIHNKPHNTPSRGKSIIEHMSTTCENESYNERQNIPQGKKWIRECLPPVVCTDKCRKYMGHKRKKRPPYPCTQRKISTYKIEKILCKYESKYNKKCKRYNIFLRKVKIPAHESNSSEMFCTLFEKRSKKE